MIPGSREKRGRGTLRVVPSAPEVALVGMPGARREGYSRGPLYLERARLIAMTEKPVIVMSRMLPGEQTQIVRRPVRKASGRRWIFIFGGAATATLLAAWLGLAHCAPVSQPVAIVGKAPAAAVAAAPIVAPLAGRSPVIQSPPAVAPVRRAARPAVTGVASGRHSKTAPAHLTTSSRLAAHRSPPRAARPAATVAWVDPFIDR